jgi:hypothetical protein
MSTLKVLAKITAETQKYHKGFLGFVIATIATPILAINEYVAYKRKLAFADASTETIDSPTTNFNPLLEGHLVYMKGKLRGVGLLMDEFFSQKLYFSEGTIRYCRTVDHLQEEENWQTDLKSCTTSSQVVLDNNVDISPQLLSTLEISSKSVTFDKKIKYISNGYWHFESDSYYNEDKDFRISYESIQEQDVSVIGVLKKKPPADINQNPLKTAWILDIYDGPVFTSIGKIQEIDKSSADYYQSSREYNTAFSNLIRFAGSFAFSTGSLFMLEHSLMKTMGMLGVTLISAHSAARLFFLFRCGRVLIPISGAVIGTKVIGGAHGEQKDKK